MEPFIKDIAQTGALKTALYELNEAMSPFGQPISRDIQLPCLSTDTTLAWEDDLSFLAH